MRFSFRVMPSSFRRLALIRGCNQMSISLWQQIDNFYKILLDNLQKSPQECRIRLRYLKAP